MKEIMHDKSYKILHCFCNLGIIETVEVGRFYECWDAPYVIIKKFQQPTKSYIHNFMYIAISLEARNFYNKTNYQQGTE